MKKAILLQELPLSKRITFTALFAALCCVGTIVLKIPAAHGFFNTGDVFVLLSGWFLGPVYGAFAAALGSGIADAILSYFPYVPATFIIKGLVAVTAYVLAYFIKKLVKKEALDFLPRLLAAIAGEAVMILGYFLFESVLYGAGTAAMSIVTTNLPQGLVCLAGAVALVAALYPVRPLHKFFPLLSAKAEV